MNKHDIRMFIIFSFLITLLAICFILIIFGIALIVATQSVGIWSNLVGFILSLCLIMILMYISPFRVREEGDVWKCPKCSAELQIVNGVVLCDCGYERDDNE